MAQAAAPARAPVFAAQGPPTGMRVSHSSTKAVGGGEGHSFLLHAALFAVLGPFALPISAAIMVKDGLGPSAPGVPGGPTARAIRAMQQDDKVTPDEVPDSVMPSLPPDRAVVPASAGVDGLDGI